MLVGSGLSLYLWTCRNDSYQTMRLSNILWYARNVRCYSNAFNFVHRITQHLPSAGRFTARNAVGIFAFERHLFLRVFSSHSCLSRKYPQITQMPPSRLHVARTFHLHPPRSYRRILTPRWSTLIRLVPQLRLWSSNHPLRHLSVRN